MSLRQLLWWVAVCVCLAGAPLEARNLFVMPSGGPNTTNVYAADSFLSGGSFAYSPASFLALATPNGAKYYIVARATTDTIIVANSAFTPMRSIPLAQVAEAAALTPDGNRLLVIAGNTLRIFSTATDTEVATIDTGGPASDLAVALDSSRAFVLSSYLQRLTAVDLNTNTVVGANSLPTAPNAVVVGPNALVYVSADSRILEIDGRSMTLTSSPSGEIAVVGRPGKLSFTPDGNYALAANLLASSTATLAVRLDLRTHTVINLPQTTFFSGVTLSRLVVASASRAFAISQGQKLYELTVDPLNFDESFLRGANNASVSAMVASNEQPQARFLFVAAQNMVYRFDITINQVNGTQGPLPFTPGNLAFAGPASSGPVAGVLQYNNAQSIAQGGTSLPLVVRVADAFTRPVYGAPVAFSTSAAGVTILTPNTVTGLDGFAQTAVNVFGATTSSVPVVASIGGGQAFATFYLTVGGVTPGVLTGMQIVSGNGQVVPEAFPTAVRPLVVRVADQTGTPVPGMVVNWQVSMGTAILSSTSTITDQDGKSFITAIGSSSNIIPPFQQAIITATSYSGSVSFYLTVLANISGNPVQPIVQILSPPDYRVSGRAGQTLTDAIRVGVVTPTGVPVPNVGMEVTGNTDPLSGPVATCSADNILTDATGFAKCDLVFGRTSGEGSLMLNVGNVRTQTISFEVTPGVPATMRTVQGDGQSGNPGQRLPVPLVVEVSDVAGNLLPGVTVLWEFSTDGTGGARLTDATTRTDSLGRVSATVTLGPRPGNLVVRVWTASASGVQATFTLRANVTLGAIVKISGDNQTALTGQAFTSPLVVEARDDQGRPVANQAVAFSVTGSATLSATSVTTDAQGRAQVTVRAGSTAGAITVTATAGNFSVTFNLSSRLPGPSITAASFLNGASRQPGVVPGGITTIVGAGLATGLQGCIGSGTITGPLPTRLGGVEVLFGVTAAPIYSVCNVGGQEQVTVQAPFELAAGGSVFVTVKVDSGQTTVSGIPVLAALPGIFETTLADGTRYVVAVRPDGTLVTPSNPARRGELIRFYVTGLGPALPLVQTNQPGVGGQLAFLPVIVGLAGSGVPVVSAEYAENMIGVFVVAFQVPDNAPSGQVNLSIGVAVGEGQPLAYSNTVRIFIQ